MCGYIRRNTLISRTEQPRIQLDDIDQRLNELEKSRLTTPYAKQKQSLQADLESFLARLPGQKSLLTSTPIDICRFLVWKDKDAKKQVHVNGCVHIGKPSLQACNCPKRLAYGTVDSYIGKLRAIFHDAGRRGEWASNLSLGNPASAPCVKNYLKAVTEEQLQARITPKQATPMFLPKLHILTSHINSKIQSPQIPTLYLSVLARDHNNVNHLFFNLAP